MVEKRDCYDVNAFGSNLKPGQEIEISRTITFRQDRADITALTALPLEELKSQRERSAAAEQLIFIGLCGATSQWEEQAAKTMLFDRAIEYIKTPAVEHSGNKWQLDKYDNNQEISNMVYKMFYRVDETLEYDSATQKRIPAVWHLTWAMGTNSPKEGYNIRFDGQDKKRFTDKAVMEKYLQGRIKAHSHLFTEISPFIPKGQEHRFSVNGQLLPGYRAAGQQEKQADERPSAVDKLHAAQKEVVKNNAEKPLPDKSVGASHDEEL